MNHHDSNVCPLLFPGVVIALNSKPIKFGSSFRSEPSLEPLGILFDLLIPWCFCSALPLTSALCSCVWEPPVFMPFSTQRSFTQWRSQISSCLEGGMLLLLFLPLPLNRSIIRQSESPAALGFYQVEGNLTPNSQEGVNSNTSSSFSSLCSFQITSTLIMLLYSTWGIRQG